MSAGAILETIEALRDAFIAVLLWERVGRMGGNDVGQALDDDIDQAYAELCDQVDDWGAQEQARWAAFKAAEAWMREHGKHAAEMAFGELQGVELASAEVLCIATGRAA